MAKTMKFFDRMLTVFLRPAQSGLDQREAQVHEEHERRRDQHPDRVDRRPSDSAGVCAIAGVGPTSVRRTPAAIEYLPPFFR